jgi:hypothetical protein
LPESPSSEERPPEPTVEELLEQFKELKVSDLLLSTMTTIGQLGYAKLEPGHRDLEQARQAIESLKALTPVLEGAVPEQTTKDFQQLVANLQLAYASAAKEPEPAEEPEPAKEPEPDG